MSKEAVHEDATKANRKLMLWFVIALIIAVLPWIVLSVL